jgi:hypothetical protein
VEPIVITKRSIELLIVMAAVGNFLGTYNDLIVKIRQAVELTRRIIRGFVERTPQSNNNLERMQAEVTASWAMGPAGDRIVDATMQSDEEEAEVERVEEQRAAAPTQLASASVPQTSGLNPLLIASLALNALLIAAIVIGTFILAYRTATSR